MDVLMSRIAGCRELRIADLVTLFLSLKSPVALANILMRGVAKEIIFLRVFASSALFPSELKKRRRQPVLRIPAAMALMLRNSGLSHWLRSSSLIDSSRKRSINIRWIWLRGSR